MKSTQLPKTNPNQPDQKGKTLSVSQLLKKYQSYADSPLRKFGDHSRKIESFSIRNLMPQVNDSDPKKDCISDNQSFDNSVDSKRSKHSNISAPAGPVLLNLYEDSNLNDSQSMNSSDKLSSDRSVSNNSVTESPARVSQFPSSPYRKSTFFNKKGSSKRNRDSLSEEKREERKVDSFNQNFEDDSFVQNPLKHSRQLSSSIFNQESAQDNSPLIDSGSGSQKQIGSLHGVPNDSKSQASKATSISNLAKQMAKIKIEIDQKKKIKSLYDFICSRFKEIAQETASDSNLPQISLL